MAYQQSDFPVFSTRPQMNVRDDDPSSPTYGQRINKDFTDEQWDRAKAETQETIDNYETNRKDGIRSIRNNLLKDTDWALVADSPLSSDDKTALQTWRQELRDLPDSNADVDLITFPDCPVASLNIATPAYPPQGSA
tara:strand:- start:1695 stop:2105 length:411 start_codon:yes stop_codon:yes gene_type:complete